MPPSRSLPPAPHLTEPVSKRTTTRTWPAWHRTVLGAFQETAHDDYAALERRNFPVRNSFGFRVGATWVATASHADRMLTVPGGGQVPCGAVSCVTVAPSYRRRGLLSAMMREQLETLVAQGFPLAGLWASESAIYARFGYGVAAWIATLSGSTASTAFLPDIPRAGSVTEVDADQYLAAARPVWEQVRREQPGMLDRSDAWWDLEVFDPDRDRDGASAYRYLVHFDDGGEVDGVGRYRLKIAFESSGPNGQITIGPVLARTPSAYAGLWRHQFDVDLVRSFRATGVCAQEPLVHLLADPRALDIRPSDGLYLRILDIPAALTARTYAGPMDLVLEVRDAFLPQVGGRFRLLGAGAEVRVERCTDDPDATLSVRDLGAAYLGGTTLGDLHRAGRVQEHTPGAVTQLSTAFGWSRPPACPDMF